MLVDEVWPTLDILTKSKINCDCISTVYQWFQRGSVWDTYCAVDNWNGVSKIKGLHHTYMTEIAEALWQTNHIVKYSINKNGSDPAYCSWKKWQKWMEEHPNDWMRITFS